MVSIAIGERNEGANQGNAILSGDRASYLSASGWQLNQMTTILESTSRIEAYSRDKIKETEITLNMQLESKPK